MNSPSDALTLQFLTWIAEAPRHYGATMEAWRTSCPRLSIWEDAIRDELVRLEPQEGRPMREARVAVTPQGLARMVACGLQVLSGARERVVSEANRVRGAADSELVACPHPNPLPQAGEGR